MLDLPSCTYTPTCCSFQRSHSAQHRPDQHLEQHHPGKEGQVAEESRQFGHPHGQELDASVRVSLPRPLSFARLQPHGNWIKWRCSGPDRFVQHALSQLRKVGAELGVSTSARIILLVGAARVRMFENPGSWAQVYTCRTSTQSRHHPIRTPSLGGAGLVRGHPRSSRACAHLEEGMCALRSREALRDVLPGSAN